MQNIIQKQVKTKQFLIKTEKYWITTNTGTYDMKKNLLIDEIYLQMNIERQQNLTGNNRENKEKNNRENKEKSKKENKEKSKKEDKKKNTKENNKKNNREN